MLYAAYGSNMNIEQMAARCPHSKISGTGLIDGYILTFQGNRFNAYCNIIRDRKHLAMKSIVPVVIWDITAADEKNLDKYEGVPRAYRKEKVSVTRIDNGAVITAMVYVMNGSPSLGFPTVQYFGTVLGGYYANRIEPEILFRAAAETARMIKNM